MQSNDPFLPAGPSAPALWQALHYNLWPLEFLEGLSRRFGDRFTIRLSGFPRFVMLGDPQAVADVFRGEPELLHSGESNQFLAPSVGSRSVLVLDGEAHSRQRRILVPPFAGERMRAHGARMRAITIDCIERWPLERAFPIEARMREITLATILEVVLGLHPSEGAELSGHLQRMLSHTRMPLALLLLRFAPHRFLARCKFLPYYRELARVDRLLFETVDLALASSQATGCSVLDDLVRARYKDGSRWSRDELRDALMTLIIAGHDTTAVSLAWVFEQVLGDPACVARLREEARSTGPDGVNLPFADATLRESLRLRTLIPFVARLLQAPFVAGGHEYPPGINLSPCIHLVHHHPDLYPEPWRFRPERFLERRYGPSEWFPFGGGNRLCLGMAFAMQQMKIVLSTTLSNVDLVREPGVRSKAVRRGLLLSPSDGVRVIATRLR